MFSHEKDSDFSLTFFVYNNLQIKTSQDEFWDVFYMDPYIYILDNKKHTDMKYN